MVLYDLHHGVDLARRHLLVVLQGLWLGQTESGVEPGMQEGPPDVQVEHLKWQSNVSIADQAITQEHKCNFTRRWRVVDARTVHPGRVLRALELMRDGA